MCVHVWCVWDLYIYILYFYIYMYLFILFVVVVRFGEGEVVQVVAQFVDRSDGLR